MKLVKKILVFYSMFVTSFAYAVSFNNIAEDGGAGIDYKHEQTSRYDTRLSQFLLPSQQTPISGQQFTSMPIHVPGKGGLLLLDYDNDGDIDIFSANVKGVANSLFQNQLSETGQLIFSEVSKAAGIDSPEHQGSGACYADIDNDGDQDIFVVGDDDSHRLYENNGNGTFADITSKSDSTMLNSVKGGTSCAFGDIDNDGLVDLHVAHAWDFDTGLACFVVPFAFNVGNELFHNNGDKSFSDISISSGIRNLANVPPGAQTITWATALVDYDQDGDLDLFNADDNCGFPLAAYGGVDRGLIQIWDNDGKGNFSNVTIKAGTNKPGQWMGLGFADLNQDGHLDFFATNMGDYLLQPVLNAPFPLGSSTSRMFLGDSDGTFSDPGASNLIATPFGWGVITEDLDNDGDTDVMFGGGIDLGIIITADNPGSVLLNDGSGNFEFDGDAMSNRGTTQNVQGIAAGDLNNDGLVDIVTTANFDMPSHFPFILSPGQVGGPFDSTAFFVPTLNIVAPGSFSWSGLTYGPGTMRIEVNQSNPQYKSVTVKAVGSIANTTEGTVNRNGIGAIISFTPDGGSAAIKPITGGASHISQSTLAMTFGLGEAKEGTLDVLWPGGVRNKLYNVKGGENIIFPEIPCSIDSIMARYKYNECVNTALTQLKESNVIDNALRGRLLGSALRAFQSE